MHSHTIFPLKQHLLTSLLLLSISPFSFNQLHHHHGAVVLAIPIPDPQTHQGPTTTTTALIRRQTQWGKEESAAAGWQSDDPDEEIFDVYFKNRAEHWDKNHLKDRSLWGYKNKKVYMDDVRKGALLVGWKPRTRKRSGGSSPTKTGTGTGTGNGAGDGSTAENKAKAAEAGGDDKNLMRMKLDGLMSNVGRTVRQAESRMQSNMNWLSTSPGSFSKSAFVPGVGAMMIAP
ncbi:MAG: hypothetical protein M1816_007588 [Peltula sp. TS41687]|nr:MAG: hypothetical protein M1816_007588 [Peltula sp. TS41687]